MKVCERCDNAMVWEADGHGGHWQCWHCAGGQLVVLRETYRRIIETIEASAAYRAMEQMERTWTNDEPTRTAVR